MSDSPSKIAVIGAGISGSFLSFLLAKNGCAQISLFEKKSLSEPQRLGKVCGGCLHHRALAILHTHGLGSILQPGVEIQLVSFVSPEKNISFALNHGKWISRQLVDTALRDIAQREGATLINQQARILDAEQGRISFGQKEEQFDCIIDCGGVGGSALPQWKEEKRSNTGFGFQGYLEGKDEKSRPLQSIACGEVRFFIDDSGYHGVVRVEGENPYFHVASYIRGRTLHTSSFLKRYFSLEELMEKSATPSLYRKREAAQGRVFLCGDALGYPEPFTGEGMSFAIQTAERLAFQISRHRGGGSSYLRDSSREWKAQVQALQEKQWRRCRWTTWILQDSLRRKVFFPLLPYIAPIASKAW